MALPYRGDEDFGTQRRGSYSPAEDVDPVKKTDVPKGFPSFQSRSSDMSKRGGFLERVRRLQEDLSHSCCSWIGDIPTLAFLVILILLILLLLGVVSLLVAWLITASDGTTFGSDANGTALTDKPAFFGTYGSHKGNDTSRENFDIVQSALPANITLCPGYGFACTLTPGIVIGTFQRCDGNKDCPDGSDEEGCLTCHTAFQCSQSVNNKTRSPYFNCLRGSKLCDSAEDCPDGTDENLYCETRECREDEWKCNYVDRCVPKRYRCDGDPHCENQSDEEHCSASECRGGAIWCKESRNCIPKWQICDGVRNCKNGIDEQNCTCRECCGGHKALCRDTNVCIGTERVCDGKSDCPDGSDEEGCIPGLPSNLLL